MRRMIRYVNVVTVTIQGAVLASAKPARAKRVSTPARSALTNAVGMRFIVRSNAPLNPTTATRSPLTMKAPIPSESVNEPGSTVASMAAPGVEKATMIGTRSLIDGTIVNSAIPMQIAQTHDVIWASFAPSARAAEKTMVMELVRPTSDATKPAVMVETEKSPAKDTEGRYRN